MNSEHYRLEALKLAVSVRLSGIGNSAIDIADDYFKWIMKDAVKAQEEAKKAELPQYKIPPNQAL